MTEENNPPYLERLRAQLGKPGEPQVACDPVNQPMIRHWCDALEDHNPVYTDAAFAAHSVHGEIVAPPTMLFSWTRPGHVPAATPLAAGPQSRFMAALAEAGYSSTIGTNTEFEFPRYLRLGEILSSVQSVSEIAPEKQTGLGAGHFLTSITEYRNQRGELAGRVTFRLLAFKPGTGRVASPAETETPAPRPVRPRPGISIDTRFFWEGLKAGELRSQRCSGCGTLHHPPRVRCPQCGGDEMGNVVSSGK